jgi:hypothetical protein
MRALQPDWDNHVNYACIMTVSAVEMEEEDVPWNLQNTLFELFVWNGSIW